GIGEIGIAQFRAVVRRETGDSELRPAVLAKGQQTLIGRDAPGSGQGLPPGLESTLGSANCQDTIAKGSKIGLLCQPIFLTNRLCRPTGSPRRRQHTFGVFPVRRLPSWCARGA